MQGDWAQTVGGLSDAVLSSMLVASLVLVVIIAVAAALASRWLADRLLARVRDVTAQARQVSAGDLSQRLALAGPQDEIKELGDTFDAMLGRLEASFAEQQRFVANASHELRTPLAANRLALEGPLAQGRFPAEVEPDVLRALEANRRSSRMLEALLKLARLQAGLPDAHALDLAEITRQACDHLRSGADGRGVQVRVDAAGAVPAWGDLTLVAEAVSNLVENSVKYSPAGCEVHVRVEGGPDGATLTVANPGQRFGADEVEQFREAFHRGPRSRRAEEGSGLGLTLVDSIARAHGGALHLSPRPEGGLVATLALPVGRPSEPAASY